MGTGDTGAICVCVSGCVGWMVSWLVGRGVCRQVGTTGLSHCFDYGREEDEGGEGGGGGKEQKPLCLCFTVRFVIPRPGLWLDYQIVETVCAKAYRIND